LLTLLASCLLSRLCFGFGTGQERLFPRLQHTAVFRRSLRAEGTDIRRTRDDTLAVSDFLREREGVVQTSTVIGGPHQRFTLVYDAREPTPVYSQIIVRVESPAQIPACRHEVSRLRGSGPGWTRSSSPCASVPGGTPRSRRASPGPIPSPCDAWRSRPRRSCAPTGRPIDMRNDWRSPVKLVTPVFNEQVGRQLGMSREDLGDAMRYAFDGLPAGSYRDGNRVLPLKMRAAERRAPGRRCHARRAALERRAGAHRAGVSGDQRLSHALGERGAAQP
jgi:multidrug efflux pump subunit AcrB